MSHSSVVSQLRRIASGALVNAVWNDKGGDSKLTVDGLRGALKALETPGDEVTPSPPSSAGQAALQIWRREVQRFRSSTFHFFVETTLYAFTPGMGGWLCAQVNQKAQVTALNSRFQEAGTLDWSPAVVQERLRELQAAWQVDWPDEPSLKASPSTSPAVSPDTDWLPVLTHELAEARRQYHATSAPPEGLKSTVEGLQLLVKSYVSSNVRLDQLLAPVEAQDLEKHLRMLRTQGFSVRGPQTLWVLRQVGNSWRVLGWDVRQPNTVNHQTLADTYLQLESGTQTSINLTALLSGVCSPEAPSAPARAVVPEQARPLTRPAPAPRPPPVRRSLPELSSALPRHRWSAVIKAELTKLQEQVRLASSHRAELDVLRIQLKDLELIRGAHLTPNQALMEWNLNTTPSEWEMRVRWLLSLASGFSVDSNSGLWFFQPAGKTWQVLGWDSRQPARVERRALTSLLRDPQDSSWPPDSIASLLKAACEVAAQSEGASDRQIMPQPQPSRAAPALQQVQVQPVAVGADLDNWHPQLAEALDLIHTQSRGSPLSRRTILDLHLLQRCYSASNRPFEGFLNQCAAERGRLRPSQLQGRRYVVQGPQTLWLIRRSRQKWVILQWAPATPTHVGYFELTAEQLPFEQGSLTLDRVIAILDQGPPMPAEAEASPSVTGSREPDQAGWPLLLERAAGRALVAESETEPQTQMPVGAETSQPVAKPREQDQAGWPLVLEEAAGRALAAESDRGPQTQQTRIQLGQDLSILRAAVLDPRLLLNAKSINTSLRTWSAAFMREYGQRFTLVSRQHLLLFERDELGWRVLRWHCEHPDEVLRSALPLTLTLPTPNWIPTEVQLPLAHAAAAMAFSLRTPSQPAPLPPLVEGAASAKPRRPGAWTDLLRPRIEVLERLSPLPLKAQAVLERLRVVETALSQDSEQVADPPLEPKQRQVWEAQVKDCQQAGRFTLMADQGLWIFQRTDEVWHVLGWTPDQAGQVGHRVLGDDLLDPHDHAWPPAALRARVEAVSSLLRPPEPVIAPIPEPEVDTLPLVAVPEASIPAAQWLGLLRGHLSGGSGDPALVHVERVLITPSMMLKPAPSGALARVTWDEELYGLGQAGTFGILGEQQVWVFQRPEPGRWQVHTWHPAAPGQVETRFLNADFLDEQDPAWPPVAVEALLEHSALALQGRPRIPPPPLMALWSGGGARLFQGFMGSVTAQGQVTGVQRNRGEEGLAALWHHTQCGGVVWALPTGREAASTHRLLSSGMVRTDELLRLLGKPLRAELPAQLSDWGAWLSEQGVGVAAAAAQAPEWQRHLLRGQWDVPLSGFPHAFEAHLATLETYLNCEEALKVEQDGDLSRIALLAVLSWLTHLDEEGQTSRQPWFGLHHSAAAVAQRITRPPIASATQLARRVQARFKLDVREEQLSAIMQLVHSPGVHLMTLPTGGGKSLVYWTAADVFANLDGKTVIVSPLQALIGDQVREAGRHGLRAEALTAGRTPQERLSLLKAYQEGQVNVLYVTPEQLVRHDVQQALRPCPPDLWVFDEAHTLTQWGMSFRPSYQQAVKVVLELGQEHARVLLTSATITLEEQRRLAALFAEIGPLQVTGREFSLPEQLRITVRVEEDDNVRLRVMYEALDKARLARHQAIIYCTTPDQAQQLADRLITFFPNQLVGVYHGQLDEDQRRQREADFLNRRLSFLVATSAYGLGVNNPGVRLVIHAYPPASVDDFVQQVGRATRHDEEAQALLLCTPRDLEVQFRLQARQLLQREDYRRVFGAVREHARTLPPDARDLWLSPLEVGLMSRLSGDAAQIRLKGELALHRLAAEGVLRMNILQPTALDITYTTEESGHSALTHSPAAAELWTHLNRPDCDSASVADLAAAVHSDPEALLKQLCELQADGLLSFTYPIRVFINKGTRVGGLRVASQRLFAAQNVLLKMTQSQEQATDQIYRFSADQLLTGLNESGALDSPAQRSDIQAALRLWEALGWARTYQPEGMPGFAVTFLPAKKDFDLLAQEGEALREATQHLVELLYSSSKGTGRNLHVAVGYRELQAAFGHLISPARLLNVLHRLRLITLGSGSDLRALGQTVEYLSHHTRTLTNLDYGSLQLDNAGRFARIHLVEALLGCRSEAEVRTFVTGYFRTPLGEFFEQNFDLPLGEAPPCRLEDLARIQLLSREQAQIVGSKERALLVVAGPGSGKTRTVVHRAAHLLRIERIPAPRILVVAFNRAAVRELRQRLYGLVGREAHDLDILTFHALALRILNINLSDLARQTGQTKGQALAQALSSALERLRSEGEDDGEERALLESFSGRYDYVLIDEYQDIDRDQYELVRLLVGHGQGEDKEKARYNLWAVGDDDQTLYQFRGAQPQFLQQFESEYGTQRRVLSDNYRSLPEITAVANGLIARSTARTKSEPHEQVRAVRASTGQPAVLYHQLPDRSSRQFVTNEILHLLASDSSLVPSDIAVLAPRWNALAPTWATLRELGVPAELLRGGTALPPYLSPHTQGALNELDRRASGLRSGYLLHQDLVQALERAKIGVHAPSIQRLLRAGQQMDEERRVTGLLETPVLIRSLHHDLKELLVEPEAIDEHRRGVTFSTFHSAKGLEFKVVFVVGTKPYYPPREDKAALWEAHLRSYYVALTRTQDLLYLVDLPGAGCEFLPKPGTVPQLHRVTRSHAERPLPDQGRVHITYDHFGDVYLGHASTRTQRVQQLLSDLTEHPQPAACEVEWQAGRGGKKRASLVFSNGAGKVGSLSKGATGELLSIFPRRNWLSAGVQLLEATEFEADSGEQHLVPVIDLNLITTFD